MNRNDIPPAKNQAGVALLEALIAILVFSLGILTVLAIQATSIRMAAEAQYRTKATLLANRLIGEMWTSGDTITELKTNFESGGDDYAKWLNDVKDPVKGLPGVVSDGDLPTTPSVTITPLNRPTEIGGTGSIVGDVAITLYWRTPTMPLTERRQHTVFSQISRNP